MWSRQQYDGDDCDDDRADDNHGVIPSVSVSDAMDSVDRPDEHLTRRVSYNDLCSSFTTACFERGLTPKQESMMVGHSAGVADRHYSDYEAMEARTKLAPDPLTEAGGSDPTGAEPAARVAQR